MIKLMSNATIFLVFLLIVFAFVGTLSAQPPTFSDQIRFTRHNLSISGLGTVKSISEKRICIFCHTPHNARPDIPYLWNRNDSAANYTPYQSSTLYASVGQPSGSSKLCLSCHDGTIALGAILSERQEISFIVGLRFIPEGTSKIGMDLSDDHPISFLYDDSLAVANGELNAPGFLPIHIRLDVNMQLQCTTCHNPHDNSFGQFLVEENRESSLCQHCHVKAGWSPSAHKNSTATWSGTGTNPWPDSIYSNVSDNGCNNCHSSHSADGHERLLNYSFEEDNCIICHSGNVASTDIEAELLKTYSHPVQNYAGIHDPSEDFTVIIQDHVECTDCHNPHWTGKDLNPIAPVVSRETEGTSGIDSSGQYISPVNNQYEICYKCHADNNVISTITLDRQIQQLNTMLEFDSSNPSFHPVEIQGVNSNVPSLLPPLISSDLIYCTDCHNSDNSAVTRGPHGSSFKYLLGENYNTMDFTTESAFSYALCYKCHDRNNILGNNSFPQHSLHIVDNSTPCSACHDAHGISASQGNSANNSHLINFDITIVQPDSQARLRFEDTGIYSGRCYLSCHSSPHEPKQYP